MGFNAAEAVEADDWTFHPWVASDGTRRTTPCVAVPAVGHCTQCAHGVFVEPTQEQVNEFMAAYASAVLDSGTKVKPLPADATSEDMAAAVAEAAATMTPEAFGQAADRMLDAYAAILSNSPSREAIGALPARVRRAFFAHVRGWLSPEAKPPATDG